VSLAEYILALYISVSANYWLIKCVYFCIACII